MPMLNALSREYASLHWALVYTLEAHAIDEWPISSARYEPSGEPVCIPQHRTIEDRLRAARRFFQTFQIQFPVVVDTVENTFEALFCTWPFRFYVLHQRRVVFQAQPEDCSYSLQSLVEAIQKLKVPSFKGIRD